MNLKGKILAALCCLALLYVIAGTIAVEYDKDLIDCKASFESEVEEIEGREFAMNMVASGNEYWKDTKIEGAESPDFPFNGSLDSILARRDAILQEKGILKLGHWWTQIKGGMRESGTGAIYIPLNPSKLRYK